MQTYKIQWAYATRPYDWMDLLEHPLYESLRPAMLTAEELQAESDGRELYRATEAD